MSLSVASFLGTDRPGVSVGAVLPDPAWRDRWDGIEVDPEIKDRLLSFGLFCLTRNTNASVVELPVHSIALLAGPPGTGKTTLAHGLANRLAEELAGRGLAEHVVFTVVDSHTFPSELLGESQRSVGRLFNHTLPELASHGIPLVVLLDEVETIAVTRNASLETNPVDVHRATDALLTGVDSLAGRFTNLLFVATTNHEVTIDPAFQSRVDVLERFDLPTPEAITRILANTLRHVGVVLDPDDDRLEKVAALCHSAALDARQVRKLVIRAIVSGGPDLALAPQTLTVDHLVQSIDMTE